MPIIDLSFDMVGTTIPLDHGYALFSALCRIVPTLHSDLRIGVHPIRGLRSAPGVLTLTGGSRLRLRLPSENLAPYIALAGSAMDVGGHRVRVGIPRVESLVPAVNLASRLVTFRGRTEPAVFEESVRQHLSRQGIRGEPSFVATADPRWSGQPKRRVMKIREKRLVGFALRVFGLTAEESLTLQENGLGGRRRFGCGLFVPVGGGHRPAGV